MDCVKSLREGRYRGRGKEFGGENEMGNVCLCIKERGGEKMSEGYSREGRTGSVLLRLILASRLKPNI